MLVAGGGDWGVGAGGYSSSAGDSVANTYGPCTNGVTFYSDSLTKPKGGQGGSYYTEGYFTDYNSGTLRLTAAVGGQGAIGAGWFVGGSGGVAGNGGTVKVSSTATIYAFNGDRITDSDYTATNSDYDASDVLTYKEYKSSSENFVEAYIYAQSGTLREVYCSTAQWGTKPNQNYSYFYGLFGSTISISGDLERATDTEDGSYYNALIRAETTTSTTGYTNSITGNNQGIGSGAGYIELSNGTYIVDPSLN